jgi:hypothetical protein
MKRTGLQSCAMVLDTRLDALKAAVTSRDWRQVEFQYDRVLRSFSKLENAIPESEELATYVVIVQRATGDGDGLYVFGESDEDLARAYTARYAGAELRREVLIDRGTARRLLAEAASEETEEQLCCDECGEPVAADPSPGVWVHDPSELGDTAYDLNEDHAARPPEGTLHPAGQ